MQKAEICWPEGPTDRTKHIYPSINQSLLVFWGPLRIQKLLMCPEEGHFASKGSLLCSKSILLLDEIFYVFGRRGPFWFPKFIQGRCNKKRDFFF